jgi:S-adenosylhomocysteine hydrolase
MDSSPTYAVKDLGLSEKGLLNIELAEQRAPAFLKIRDRLENEKPFAAEAQGKWIQRKN